MSVKKLFMIFILSFYSGQDKAKYYLNNSELDD